MEIKTLSATFGRLDNQTLPLSSGLNVIEAGNESGKSTWMAFVRVMLYGLNTRDRGVNADKHRYAPWSGLAMQGRMDCTVGGKDITILRTTSRANAPMGTFSAEYTNTTISVPNLTATSLGETLTGVPQEVLERSAFIRQSGLSIDQSTALERRINALLTTGEESSSYTDAAERLRKQLNRRRYRQNGLLPQLEGELSTLESTLHEITSLEHTVRICEQERKTLLEQESYLRHQLTLLDASDNAHLVEKFRNARKELEDADTVCDAAAARIAHLPSQSELRALLGEFSAVEAIRDAVNTAHNRTLSLSSIWEQAQQQVDDHPFAPQTPKEIADAPMADLPRPAFPTVLAVLCTLLSLLCAPLLYFTVHFPPLLCGGLSSVGAMVSYYVLGIRTARQRKEWEVELRQQQTARQEAIAAYATLYRDALEKRTAYRTAVDTHRTLAADYHLHLERILSRVQRFQTVHTLSDAQRTVENALRLYTAFDLSVQKREQAQLRFDLLAESTPQDAIPSAELPTLTRDEVERRCDEVATRLSALQRQMHTAQGRIQALGDPTLLRTEIEQKRRHHAVLTEEYEAISLAQSVLTEANTTMQNRFSPVLGEKAATIFTKLTKGKYNKVLLDRKMVPSAQEDGDILSHEVFTLSQGAADQLYLAVRLAICDMVLPKDRCVPIFLDDALVTFDDIRMAAALDYLVELSEQRQILLFTCQQRELAYLRTAHAGRYHAITLS